MEPLALTYFNNAVSILKSERRKSARVNYVYCKLLKKQNRIEAGLVDYLGNPFIRTALLILEKLQGGNYKIQQAIKLLREAGSENEKEKQSKKKKR